MPPSLGRKELRVRRIFLVFTALLLTVWLWPPPPLHHLGACQNWGISGPTCDWQNKSLHSNGILSSSVYTLITEKHCSTGHSQSEKLGGLTTTPPSGLFHLLKYLERGLAFVCFYYEYKIYVRHNTHLHIYNLPSLSSCLSSSLSAGPSCPLLPLLSAHTHDVRFTSVPAGLPKQCQGQLYNDWLSRPSHRVFHSTVSVTPCLPLPQTSGIKTQEKRGWH